MALSDHIKKDTPTNNFATWNSLDTTATVSDGNLKVVTGSVKTFSNIFLPKLAGKFYVEYYVESMGFPFLGIYNHNTGTHSVFYSTNQPNESIKIKSVNTANTFEVSTGDIVSVLVDTTNETIQWFKNGGSTSSNTSSSYTLDDLADNDYSFYTVHASGAGTSTIRINFGQDPTFGGTKTSANGAGGYTTDGTDETGGAFFYQPPAGAKALCTANLEDITPNVDDDVPSDYMKAVTYTGTSSADSGTTFDNLVGFQSDLVWIKERGGGAHHQLFDSVRGTNVSAKTGKSLASSSTAAEDSAGGSYSGELYQFTSEGFKLNRSSSGRANGSNATYVAWCWKAGGAPSADGKIKIDETESNISDLVTSTGASLTPTRMSVNTKAGFSIVKYNGNNGGGDVPHGLSKKPDFLIARPLTTTSDWIVWHKDLGNNFNDGFIYLNLTTQSATVTNYWGSNGINNNTFGLYAGHQLAGNNKTNAGTSPYPHIAYCWHSVPGYSKFGSYEGASEVFVNLGFRPAFVMVKCINAPTSNQSYYSWTMCDSSRTPYNGVTVPLYANYSKIEGQRAGDTNTFPTDGIDFLSNGFRILSPNYGELNVGAGYNYLYAAFAEQPLKYATAR